jgi:hypothetical protein
MEIDDITSSVDVSMDEDDVSGVVCRSANNSPSANALRRTMLAAWSILPAELRVHIISWFDAKSLCTGAQVCHQWKYICDNEKLWEAHCRRLDKNATKPEGRTWKWLYRCKTVAFVKGVSMTHGWLEIEEPKGIYFGEWSNDVFNGMGFFEWHQHGLKYVGTYSAGFRQGQGSLVWRNGDQYTGEFEADMKHGLGTFVWSNGDVYSGNYDKDKKQGRGRITWGSHPGECYDGDWFQDKKQGYGKYIWSNGGSYEGHWFDNKRNGRGVEKWPSGSVYDGMWVENEMHGWGHKVCTRDTRPDGFYEGPFVDGRAHGRGYREYEDGSTYEGDYVADKRVGFGTYTWKDGEYFSGTWSVGRERGFYMSNNGNTFYQEWFEDKLKEDRRTGAELYQVSSSTTRWTE